MAVLSAHGAAVGCGSSEHVFGLGDQYGRTRTSADAAPGFDFDSPLPELTCNLGPEAGVCACIDEPLFPNAPNLYFVLDRSGSMSEPWGTGGSDKWQVVVDAIWQLVVALGPRANIGAAVFPDPMSGADTCGPGAEVFASRPGDSPAGRPGPTATSLRTALGRILPNGGTPTAATLQSPWLMQRLRSLATTGPTYVILATDGGPNCNPNATCGLDRGGELYCQPNIESAPGCPTGMTPNCCAKPEYGARACEDSQPTKDAVTMLSASGFPVYVIGVPGSAPYATLLTDLAIAGAGGADGGAGAMGPDGGSAAHYFAADTADQALFIQAISRIAAQLTGGCTLQLDKTPPDPMLVNVFLGGKVLPKSGPDGWTLDGTNVTIEGASCQSILNGEVLDVRVVAGCPVVLL
jgi:hypothetical protein